MSSISQNLKNKVKLTFRRKEFWNFSDFEFKFSSASDFEIKNLKRVTFWSKSFTKRQILDWKKYNALDFEFKIFPHVSVWKKCLHPENHVLIQFTPWKRHYLHFWCIFKKYDFEMEIFKTRQILI